MIKINARHSSRPKYIIYRDEIMKLVRMSFWAKVTDILLGGLGIRLGWAEWAGLGYEWSR